MPNTPRRNELCPCGSGKKFKYCHGLSASDTPDETYARLRQMDGEASALLSAFALSRFGKEGLQRAVDEFFLGFAENENLDDLDTEALERWMHFTWKPDGKRTLPTIYLLESHHDLRPDLAEFMRTVSSRPYSFYQVIEVVPGIQMTVNDIFLRSRLTITERSSTQSLLPGNLIYARTVVMHGITFMMGTGRTSITYMALDHLLNTRGHLAETAKVSEDAITPRMLLDADEELRWTYFDIVRVEANRKLQVHNNDGDPIEFHTLTYEVPSFAVAFDALKSLQLTTTRGQEENLRVEEKDETGIRIRAIVHWFKKGPSPDVLATLSIGDTRVIIRTNSAKRAGRVRKEIDKRLGNKATLLNTVIEPLEGPLRKASRTGKSAQRGEQRAERRNNDITIPPETREVLRKMSDEHWSTWPDIPVPALRNMTPRQAAKDRIGRELLESLLLEFETARSLQGGLNSPGPDIARLRKELGMEKRR